jgi:uncharacterized protein YkwD
VLSSRLHIRLASLLVGACLLCLAGAPAASAAKPLAAATPACASASSAPGAVARRVVLRATLCVLNAERRARRLRPLRLNRRLSRASRRHARDMVRRRYFSHDSLSGADFVDRIRRTGYLRSARRWSVGENLAWGSGERATPRSILRAWMGSRGHRANILTARFREIGIGVAYGAPRGASSPAATYATSFGARR